METSLRIILLAIGLAIVAGIIWDLKRGRVGGRPKNIRREGVLDDIEVEITQQMETVTTVTEPTLSSKQGASQKASEIHQEAVIALQVMAKPSKVFSGNALFSALNEVHLYYGDWQIFHRYADVHGEGKILFSAASAIEPGYFDLSNVETVQIPGITLFFVLSDPNASIAAFEVMLRTAKQLAIRMDGEVKDDRYQTLTLQAIERYRSKVRQEYSPLAMDTLSRVF